MVKTRDLLKSGLSQMDIEYTEAMVDSFIKYKNILQDYNQKVNLTAITDDEGVVVKHFLDSLATIKAFDIDKGSKVLDVGSGAGFPLVPMKIVMPDLRAVLADSLNKRIVFLENLIDLLSLRDIKAIHIRAEDMAHKKEERESYDLVVARAVSQINILIEYTAPLVKVGGNILMLKGPKVQEEVDQGKKAIKVLGCKIREVKEVRVPYLEEERYVVIIDKIKTSPKKYPRNPGKIKKNPL